MKKSLIKVELTVKLFIHSGFVIEIFKKIQTLKPIILLKTANQYSVSVSAAKDTNTACKHFTGRLLDKTHHGKTISVQNLFIEVNFNQLLSVYFRGY